MSTLQTINVKHPSSASNNVVLDNSGNTTISGNATISGSATVGGVAVVTTTGTQTLTNKTLTSPALTSPTISGTPVMGASVLTLDVAKTATGANVDFTGIPSWVRRVTVVFNGVSTNGTSNIQVQIGSGSFVTTGYSSSTAQSNNPVPLSNFTTGFSLSQTSSAANTQQGAVTLTTIGGNSWVLSATIWASAGSINSSAGVSPALSGALDRIRITTVNGTDQFDAGTINIMYE